MDDLNNPICARCQKRKDGEKPECIDQSYCKSGELGRFGEKRTQAGWVEKKLTSHRLPVWMAQSSTAEEYEEALKFNDNEIPIESVKWSSVNDVLDMMKSLGDEI